MTDPFIIIIVTISIVVVVVVSIIIVVVVLFSYSGCWSSNINLIPLMGAASKLFWKTLKGPEVKPVELYFGILNVDSKSSNFQKMLKKKVVSDTSIH